MIAAELNALERDVEQARAKFAGDLARLRSLSRMISGQTRARPKTRLSIRPRKRPKTARNVFWQS
jgi:hypothetical protein